MTRKRTVRRRPGNVIAVPLGDGRVAFGLDLTSPLIAFFDLCAKEGEEPEVEEIVRKTVAFRIWVAHQPIKDGSWPVIGHVEVPESLSEPPWFFKQDAVSNKLSVTHWGDVEHPATPEQVKKLERAAVWSANHVVDRLRDHCDRKPNKWVESLRYKP